MIETLADLEALHAPDLAPGGRRMQVHFDREDT